MSEYMWAWQQGYDDALRGFGPDDQPFECADGEALDAWRNGWNEANTELEIRYERCN